MTQEQVSSVTYSSSTLLLLSTLVFVYCGVFNDIHKFHKLVTYPHATLHGTIDL